MVKITKQNMATFLDQPNPHLIIAVNRHRGVCGIIARESRCPNHWAVHWNYGELGVMYPSVENLISNEWDREIQFYFTSL